MTEVAPTTDPDAIVLDYELDEPAEKVWRALTDPALVAAWLAPNDLTPNVGDRFSLQPPGQDVIEGEVLESEPQRRLSWRWREGDGALDSVVTFEITPLPQGRAHLRLVHRELEIAGSGGMVGVANDNLCARSLAWAA